MDWTVKIFALPGALKPYNLHILVLLGFGVYKFTPVVYKKLVKSKSENETDCFFFTPIKVTCSRECSDLQLASSETIEIPVPCNGCSLKKLLSALERTKTQLDICMYLITYEEICHTIIKLFKRGVHVRIILDKQMSEEAFGVKVLMFRKEYIPIRIIQSYSMMHNKFAIVDKRFVITGSINWTRQGFTGNYENILVISHSKTAQKYSQYFQLLWTMKDD